MKTWILLLALLSPAIARANTVTPSFTTGSMQSTTTTQQTITETIEHDIKGSASSSWSGTNITVTGSIGADNATYAPTTNAADWDLQITTREAGTIETISIEREIETDSTTSSYSIFSQ
jgi:hypothetical protein|tara:strand:- start:248 stop:604 length:357 start_codon:yes stop_codon:yes gene_type:complete